MSLINKMLQDLDARGGKPGAALGQQALKPVLAGGRSHRTVIVAAATAGAVLLAAGGWLGWRYVQGHTAKPSGAPVMTAVPSDPKAAAEAARAQAQADRARVLAQAAGPAAATGSSAAAHSDGAPAGVAQGQPAGPADGKAMAAVPGETAASPVVAAAAPVQPAPTAKAEARQHTAHADDAEEAPVQDMREMVVQRRSRRQAQAAALAGMDNDHTMSDDDLAANGSKRHAGSQIAATGKAGAKAARKAVAKGDGTSRKAGADGGVTRELGPAQLAENSYRRALAALQEGRISEAVAGLERTLEIEPRHEAARQTLVTLLLENKRPDDAMRQLRQALALDPAQPALAMVLARLQLERGGPALDTLMHTLPNAVGNADYQGLLAGVLQREQRHAEAVQHYQAALKLAPQNAVWWMGLGISQQAGQHLPEARDAYQRAKAAGSLTPELQAFVERKLEQLAR